MNRNIQRTVILIGCGLSLLGSVPTSAAPRLIEERDFRLSKSESDHVVFSIPEAGLLVLRARIRQPFASVPVRVLLEGPGGLRVEKEGSAPLRLRYPVSAARIGESWRATVINVGRLPNVTGELTVEIQHRGTRALDTPSDNEGHNVEPDVTDGKVSIVDDRRLRAVCRDRNTDISLRIDLEQGSGELLMRFNHVFSFKVHQASQDRIELRGGGAQELYLDLASQAIVFASREDGAFCRVRIYRQGER